MTRTTSHRNTYPSATSWKPKSYKSVTTSFLDFPLSMPLSTPATSEWNDREKARFVEQRTKHVYIHTGGGKEPKIPRQMPPLFSTNTCTNKSFSIDGRHKYVDVSAESTRVDLTHTKTIIHIQTGATSHRYWLISSHIFSV